MFKDLKCFDELIPGKKILKRGNVKGALKISVWQKHYGSEEEGKCLFCENKINRKICHFAHDVAHKDGGEQNIYNLYPCCKDCNLRMKTKTAEEYYEEQNNI